jgi:hypothetical protein
MQNARDARYPVTERREMGRDSTGMENGGQWTIYVTRVEVEGKNLCQLKIHLFVLVKLTGSAHQIRKATLCLRSSEKLFW